MVHLVVVNVRRINALTTVSETLMISPVVEEKSRALHGAVRDLQPYQ